MKVQSFLQSYRYTSLFKKHFYYELQLEVNSISSVNNTITYVDPNKVR